MTERAHENPEAWADRRPRGDGATGRGTSGALPGTSGAERGQLWSALLSGRAWALAIALIGLVTFVNVMTILDDARSRGVTLPLSLPLTLEVTSSLAALLCVFIIAYAVHLAPPGRGPLWRTIAVHVVGSLAFSAAHVGLMVLFRTVIFGLSGKPYHWSPAELPYEYRKDLLTYAVVGVLFWLLSRRAIPPAQAPANAPKDTAVADPVAPAAFDIRDGASILRVPVREILAAQAAGNYVEFALEDGRRPLMRGSMAAVEAALAPHGFVRTHRSWLVNAARVRALTAAGSGDFRLDLGCSLTAPLSRRYRAALARIRGEG
jgi:hypothetical protein